MPISTINQNGLTNPLTSVTANTVTSAAATALTLQSAGTTAVTISTAQNVGIGTTSPAYALDVRSTAAPAIRLSRSGTAGQIASMVFEDGNATLGSGSTTRVASDAGAMSFSTGGTSGAVTGGTERMRIDSSGNVLVNTTSSTGHKMVVQSAAGAGGIDCVGGATNGYYAMRVDMPSTNTYGVLFRNNGNNVGDIRINSSTTTYNTSSDYRLKQNIQPMTGALARVAKLKPVTYNWIRENQAGEGFIAHELQEVVPEAVTGTKDAVDEEGNPVYQAIDQSVLVATLTAAIQELKAEFDAYKASHP